MSTNVLKARSAVGLATRRGKAEEVIQARRELAAAKIEQYIQRVVNEAPALTDEQLDKIALLLRPRGANNER